MDKEDRIKVRSNGHGTLEIDFFYYTDWHFTVPESETRSADHVLDYISRLWLRRGNYRLEKGLDNYEDSLREAIENELSGGSK